MDFFEARHSIQKRLQRSDSGRSVMESYRQTPAISGRPVFQQQQIACWHHAAVVF